MQTFYRICLGLLIAGGINWGLVGMFQFDLAGWLLGGSTSVWSRILFTLVGAAALCTVPDLFRPGGLEPVGDYPLRHGLRRATLFPFLASPSSPDRGKSVKGRGSGEEKKALGFAKGSPLGRAVTAGD